MYIFIGMMKSDCRCSCALTSSAHGWKQQQQSTNQKPRRNHFERYLKGVHFPCDDATAVPFLIQKNIRFLFSIRHLLHLCFARLDFKSRATTTQKAKANGLVCCVQVPDCPVSLCPFLFFFFCVCTFSDPRGFDDFSGESNNHKKKKGEKEKERIPRDAVIVGALVGISNSVSSNGTRRDWNIRHMWARKRKQKTGFDMDEYENRNGR